MAKAKSPLNCIGFENESGLALRGTAQIEATLELQGNCRNIYGIFLFCLLFLERHGHKLHPEFGEKKDQKNVFVLGIKPSRQMFHNVTTSLPAAAAMGFDPSGFFFSD